MFSEFTSGVYSEVWGFFEEKRKYEFVSALDAISRETHPVVLHLQNFALF